MNFVNPDEGMTSQRRFNLTKRKEETCATRPDNAVRGEEKHSLPAV